jgi:hypothetical protein
MTHHLKHAAGAMLFILLLASAYTLEAQACSEYPKPNPVPVIACTVC